MNEHWEDILEKARSVFMTNCIRSRDALLETGRLLHEFILAHLRLAEGVGEVRRVRTGLTRENAIAIAANCLGVNRQKISKLLVASMVVELLGEGADLGQIAHHSIRAFSIFVRRSSGTRRDYPGKAGGRPVTDAEKWQVIPQFAEEAKSLFARAVAERFVQSKAADECGQLFRSKKDINEEQFAYPRHFRRGIAGNSGKGNYEQLLSSASKASSGDVAEMCLELIEANEDPKAVAMKLQAMLQKILTRRLESMLA